MRRFGRTIVTVGFALLVVSGAVTPAVAAGPRIMIVYGKPLAKPVIFSNWGENETLLVSVNDDMSVGQARLARRPFLRVAMFWGPAWIQYMKHHATAHGLRPNEANQLARFYPAYGTAPALFMFDSIPGPYRTLIRRIRPAGVAVLAHQGIPVRLPVRTEDKSARQLDEPVGYAQTRACVGRRFYSCRISFLSTCFLGFRLRRARNFSAIHSKVTSRKNTMKCRSSAKSDGSCWEWTRFACSIAATHELLITSKQWVDPWYSSSMPRAHSRCPLTASSFGEPRTATLHRFHSTMAISSLIPNSGASNEM